MQGIFTALLTPFNADYTVNEKSLQKLVEFNLEKGVTASMSAAAQAREC